jgi:hypothetical protein
VGVPSAGSLEAYPATRSWRQVIRDSGETTDQYETAFQYLEDVAAHADNDEEGSAVWQQQGISG